MAVLTQATKEMLRTRIYSFMMPNRSYVIIDAFYAGLVHPLLLVCA